MGDNPGIYTPGSTRFTVALPERERLALVELRDSTFPGQPLELVMRKLVQDGLIGCGLLGLSAGNRSKGARAASPTEKPQS